jgi:hypothetical protein
MTVLENYNASSVEKIATESIRAEVPPEELEKVLSTRDLKAAELERPIRLFDSGN